MIYKTLHRTLNIEEYEPTKNLEWTQALRKGQQYPIHYWQVFFN
jgi:hypothetical protein